MFVLPELENVFLTALLTFFIAPEILAIFPAAPTVIPSNAASFKILPASCFVKPSSELNLSETFTARLVPAEIAAVAIRLVPPVATPMQSTPLVAPANDDIPDEIDEEDVEF